MEVITCYNLEEEMAEPEIINGDSMEKKKLRDLETKMKKIMIIVRNHDKKKNITRKMKQTEKEELSSYIEEETAKITQVSTEKNRLKDQETMKKKKKKLEEIARAIQKRRIYDAKKKQDQEIHAHETAKNKEKFILIDQELIKKMAEKKKNYEEREVSFYSLEEDEINGDGTEKKKLRDQETKKKKMMMMMLKHSNKKKSTITVKKKKKQTGKEDLSCYSDDDEEEIAEDHTEREKLKEEDEEQITGERSDHKENFEEVEKREWEWWKEVYLRTIAMEYGKKNEAIDEEQYPFPSIVVYRDEINMDLQVDSSDSSELSIEDMVIEMCLSVLEDDERTDFDGKCKVAEDCFSEQSK